MNPEDIHVGLLVARAAYPNQVYMVLKEDDPKAILICNVVTAERSKVSYINLKKLPVQNSTRTTPLDNVSRLVSGDPSNGEATHYVKDQRVCEKYHRLSAEGKVLSFWVRRDETGMKGYWKDYPVLSDVSYLLDTAIIINQPAKVVKKQPTREDYEAAQERTCFKHDARSKLIQVEIQVLVSKQVDLNNLYSRKLRRVAEFIRGSK